MRIIAGRDRGRTIEAPIGMDTRPTVDRVRESIMSAVYSSIGELDELCALDLFAGSGALGIESLSRGCKFVLFNDMNGCARKCIERNLGNLGYEPNRFKISSIDAFSNAALPIPYPANLVFLDPPYDIDQTSVYEAINRFISNGSISKDALMVYEHDVMADSDMLSQHGFQLLKEKKYGKTYVTYFSQA